MGKANSKSKEKRAEGGSSLASRSTRNDNDDQKKNRVNSVHSLTVNNLTVQNFTVLFSNVDTFNQAKM